MWAAKRLCCLLGICFLGKPFERYGIPTTARDTPGSGYKDAKLEARGIGDRRYAFHDSCSICSPVSGVLSSNLILNNASLAIKRVFFYTV